MSGCKITSLDTLPELSNANTTSKWFRGDNEDRYEQNVREGKEMVYGRDDITYNFNSLGFRCPEFDEPTANPKMAFYGCSVLQGYGLPDQHTIPFVTANLQGYTPYNLGIAGASNDLIARCITSTVPILSPKLVVILWTYHTRREIYKENGEPIQWLHNWKKQTVRVEDEVSPYMDAQEQLTNFASNVNNQLRNMTLVDLFLKYRNIPYVWTMVGTSHLERDGVREKFASFQDNFVDMPGIRDQWIDSSRDFTHPGYQTAQNVSNHISKTISKVC